jgi:peptide deformylase
LSRLPYGAGPAGILPVCRQGLGRVPRFLAINGAACTAKAGIKLSSGGTLTTIFGQKHDIHLITPMTKLVILEYPDPRLRKKAEPVAVVDDALRRLADDLLETMYAAKGVGLAASQVDVHKRLLVLDVSDTRDQPLILINPEILSAEGRVPGEEGCLSLPGIYDKLERAARIRVRALDRNGEPFEMDADGMLAVCIQHEMDHLDGKLFVDYLSELKRQLIRRRLQKERKQRSAGSEIRASVPAL